MRAYFNPRSRIGNDCINQYIRGYCWRFQSTFPHRERQNSAIEVCGRDIFQSTFPHRERQQTYLNPSHNTGTFLYNSPNLFKHILISKIYFNTIYGFCTLFWCESLWDFLYASHSHQTQKNQYPTYNSFCLYTLQSFPYYYLDVPI